MENPLATQSQNGMETGVKERLRGWEFGAEGLGLGVNKEGTPSYRTVLMNPIAIAILILITRGPLLVGLNA